MGDNYKQPEPTEELLRMIGREVQGVRAAAERTASNTGWLVLLMVGLTAIVALWVFGIVTIEFQPVR